jgi:hypothetical protein
VVSKIVASATSVTMKKRLRNQVKHPKKSLNYYQICAMTLPWNS